MIADTADKEPSLLIRRNRERFELYFRSAQAAFAASDYGAAAAFAQVAAGCAWMRHAGFFYSAELESLLAGISQKTQDFSQATKQSQSIGRRKKIFHVLTQGFGTGGHTRLVWNWIESDPSNEHHVLITQQGAADVPEQLRQAAQRSGGSLRLLDGRGGLIRIASSLRRRSSSAACIVLHVHPNDVTPLLAFAGGVNHPPIAYLNHADHVFWLGVTICDVNLNLRRAGLRLSVTRRGVPPERNYILPLPMTPAATARQRDHARRQLGIGHGEILIVTIAGGHKFLPIGSEIDFGRLHLPIAHRHPMVRFIVVGPSQGDQYWRDLEAKSQGRIRAVGRKSDIGVFLQAADIYCDSVPCNSLTSILEAGLAGVPCASYRAFGPELLEAVLTSDDVAFTGTSVGSEDVGRYTGLLEDLISLHDRTDEGKQLEQSIAQVHVAPRWGDTVDGAYRSAISRRQLRRHADNVVQSPLARYDQILAAWQEPDGIFTGDVSASLPLAIRMEILRKNGASFAGLAKALLPPWLARVVKRFTRLLSTRGS